MLHPSSLSTLVWQLWLAGRTGCQAGAPPCSATSDRPDARLLACRATTCRRAACSQPRGLCCRWSLCALAGGLPSTGAGQLLCLLWCLRLQDRLPSLAGRPTQDVKQTAATFLLSRSTPAAPCAERPAALRTLCHLQVRQRLVPRPQASAPASAAAAPAARPQAPAPPAAEADDGRAEQLASALALVDSLTRCAGLPGDVTSSTCTSTCQHWRQHLHLPTSLLAWDVP